MKTKNKNCECFLKHFELQANWMSFTENGVKTKLMPYTLNHEEDKIRFNYCPVCGVEVRDIQIIETNDIQFKVELKAIDNNELLKERQNKHPF